MPNSNVPDVFHVDVAGHQAVTATHYHAATPRLGASLVLEFRQPSPVSATARLNVVSRHRLPLPVDGVILMGDTCIIGPSPHAHVRAPGLPGPVVLYRQGDDLWCRAPGAFEVDGRPCQARAPLAPRSSVQGEAFSFSLEPLATEPGRA